MAQWLSQILSAHAPLPSERVAIQASRMLKVLKIGWVMVVAGAALYYLQLHFDQFWTALTGVRPGQLIAATGLILAAKCLTALQMRHSLVALGVEVAPREAFQFYAFADVAKYIPGGVWGVLTRTVLYRKAGLSNDRILRAMALEHLWLIGGAAFFGGGLWLSARVACTGSMGAAKANACAWFTGAVITAGLAALVALSLWATAHSWRWQRSMRIGGEQAAMWTLYGLSLWVLLPSSSPALLAIGSLSVAFATGFLAVFAPAGIGVREGVLVFLMTPVLAPDPLIVAALLHRAVYFLADFLLAGAVALSRIGRS